MSAAAKLTKRQQKALAHRSGAASRADKKKAKREVLDSLQGLPEADDGVAGNGEGASTASENESSKRTKGKGKATGDEAVETAQESGEGKVPPVKKAKKASRLICFCGNLPYNVTRDQIAQYFTFEGNIPRVRLLTNKSTGQDDPGKSKGFAFLEFTSPNALQHALKLHHSTLSGRKINVELSAGGGGNSAVRKAKIEKARVKLDAERSAKVKKVKAKKEESKEEKAREREQESKAASKKRKAEEDAGFKKVKKPWLSGANAMRLG